MHNSITGLFWYSLYRFNNKPNLLSTHFFRRLLGKEKENYGDLLSKYLVEKIIGKSTKWINPKIDSDEYNLFAIGSILNLSNSKSIVWGSGIIDIKHKIEAKDFRAVRGPLTRKRVLECGMQCPETYGDPAVLLSEYYNPKINKKFDLGIIPHIYDLRLASQLFKNCPEIKVINLFTHDIEKTTREIIGCKRIISSSLHGIIVPHTYNIPAIWCKFSNNLIGDNIKFQDYFASVGMTAYEGEYIYNKNIDEIKTMFTKYNSLPNRDVITEIKENLLLSFPFQGD